MIDLNGSPIYSLFITHHNGNGNYVFQILGEINTVPVPHSRIIESHILEGIKKELTETGNLANTSYYGAPPSDPGASQWLSKLRQCSVSATEYLIPSEIRNQLGQCQGNGILQILACGGIEFPWHLLSVEEQLLCERFRVTYTFVSENTNLPASVYCHSQPIACHLSGRDLDQKRVNEFNNEFQFDIVQAAVSMDMTKYNIVHITSHCNVPTGVGGPSLTDWTLRVGKTVADDVTLWEIGNRFRVNASIVFLNACNSGTAVTWQSSFASRFRAAGAATVIAANFFAIEETAWIIAAGFYRKLKGGKYTAASCFEAIYAAIDEAVDCGGVPRLTYVFHGYLGRLGLASQ